MPRNRLLIVCTVCALALQPLVLPGCESRPIADTSQAHKDEQLRLLGRLYGEYLAKHDGAAPADEKQLIAFIETERRQLDSLGIKSAEEILTSPHDGNRLVILYGNQIIADGPGGLPWVAYEQAGVDGKRYAIGARGVASEMGPEEFAGVFGESP